METRVEPDVADVAIVTGRDDPLRSDSSATTVGQHDATRHKLLVHGIQVGLVAALIGFWQHMASGSKSIRLTVSTPSEVVRWLGSWAFGGDIPHGNGWSDLFLTLKEAFFGCLLGVVIGVFLGALLGSVRWLRDFFWPFVAVANAFPKVALAPLLILIMGSTLQMKAYFVASGILFITFFAVFNGLRSIDVNVIRNSRIMGASGLWLVRSVYAPAIVSWLTASLRLTVGWSLSMAVVVEYLTANKGMGYVITFGQANLEVAQAIGDILIVSTVALILDRLTVMISRRITPWRQP